MLSRCRCSPSRARAIAVAGRVRERRLAVNELDRRRRCLITANLPLRSLASASASSPRARLNSGRLPCWRSRARAISCSATHLSRSSSAGRSTRSSANAHACAISSALAFCASAVSSAVSPLAAEARCSTGIVWRGQKFPVQALPTLSSVSNTCFAWVSAFGPF